MKGSTANAAPRSEGRAGILGPDALPGNVVSGQGGAKISQKCGFARQADSWHQRSMLYHGKRFNELTSPQQSELYVCKYIYKTVSVCVCI